MNYPPGTSAGDPRAPWNQSPPPECEECGGVYTDDGHETIDGEPCPNDGMNEADYEDAEASYHAEMRFDALRDDGKL